MTHIERVGSFEIRQRLGGRGDSLFIIYVRGGRRLCSNSIGSEGFKMCGEHNGAVWHDV